MSRWGNPDRAAHGLQEVPSDMVETLRAAGSDAAVRVDLPVGQDQRGWVDHPQITLWVWLLKRATNGSGSHAAPRPAAVLPVEQ
jgi:hypothetical protein